MFERIFSGSAADMSRWNPWGLIVMALGVILNFCAAKIAKTNAARQMILRLVGLGMTALGALIALRIL